MKNNNGFTLVEIIVSLTLIILIMGVISTVVLLNKSNKDKKIVAITKKLQDAAGVYLSVNKDLNTKIEENIYNGGNGYAISLETLLNEGYISESYITTLEQNGVKINLKKDYMLAAVFADDQSQCNSNTPTITIEASYDLEQNKSEYYLCNFNTKKVYVYYDLNGGSFIDETEQIVLSNQGFNHEITTIIPSKEADGNYSYTFKEWNDKKDCTGNTLIGNINITDSKIIYACYNKTTIEKESTYKEILLNTRFTKNYNKLAVSEEWCKNNPGYDETKIVCDENGIFTYYDLDTDTTYNYSRGAIKNNYLKFKDKLWRIVWISSNESEKKMKLVLDDEINIKINDNIEIEAGDALIRVKDSKVFKNISESAFNNPSEVSGSNFDLDFYYLSSSGAFANDKFYDETVVSGKYSTNFIKTKLIYDLDKTINIEDSFKKYYALDFVPDKNYLNNSQYNKERNIYYKYMYDSANYNEPYVLGMSEFCEPREIKSTDKFDITCTKNLINDDKVTKDSRVSYLTLDELKMAGVGTMLENSSLDNYLLPKDNDVFIIADVLEVDGGMDTYYYHYKISESGLSKVKNLTSVNTPTFEIFNYSGKGCGSSGGQRLYYIFYKNGICDNLYCQSSLDQKLESSTNCKEVRVYKRFREYKFDFGANAVKPAIIIDLNQINLSNNSGTINDPYTLVK